MKRAIVSTRIYTGVTDAPFAEALLMEDGLITAVGTTKEIMSRLTPDTTVSSLSGHLVVPGLVDAHSHLASYGLTLTRVNLVGLPSLAACRKAISEAVAQAEPGTWIIGRGWNHHFWEEHREPTRADLDDISPNHPVVMTRACGHLIWVNEKALEMAGVTKETVTPEGGQIDRDAHGVPTGIVRECLEVIRDHIPSVTHEERKAAILEAQERTLAFGLTGTHVCEELDDYLAYAELEKEGKLKLRVCHLLPPEDLEKADGLGITAGSGSEHLWHTHVKLFMDGSLGAETAWMFEAYEGSPGCCGLACLTNEELLAQIEMAYKTGRSVAIHAIGDRAVSTALDGFAAMREQYPGARRDRIEHVQRVTDEDLNRFKEMDVTASVQPGFLPTDWKTAEAKWGLPRCRHAYTWKRIQEAGIRMQFGSDVPVESNDPMIGIRAAMFRTDAEDKPTGGWFPEEALTFWEAIDGYTKTAAWTAGVEDKAGIIAPGKWADLTIFDDAFDEPEKAVLRASVVKTIVGGKEMIGKSGPRTNRA
ncbi:amidohydrolase [Desulfoluna spongiiphila]|uniref:amidohydrolase n=1 Tax=Desulfoluna spongiiphila TaxID=419481 RepID=UPI0012588690|nr:amidohydrolase [Desulfoluna spongiiphila]VVS95602.1 amidohydrolase 3 [Desulfoluna spongiiphila]